MKPGLTHGLTTIIFCILIVWGAACNHKHLEARKMALAEKDGCMKIIETHVVIDSRYEWDDWKGCLLIEVENEELVRGDD